MRSGREYAFTWWSRQPRNGIHAGILVILDVAAVAAFGLALATRQYDDPSMIVLQWVIMVSFAVDAVRLLIGLTVKRSLT